MIISKGVLFLPFLNKYKKIVSKSLEYKKTFIEKSDDDILKEFKNTSDMDKILGLISIACERTINKIPYDVQLIGAMAINDKNIAEIKTGEGKSLIAAIAAIILVHEKRNVHIMTVNEYLVKRDYLEFKDLFDFFDIKVAFITSKLEPKKKKKAYSADVVYGVASEFAFDYLKDNIAQTKDDVVQKELDFAIIDEADSVLIDEAKTPMILSHSISSKSNLFEKASAFVKSLSSVEKEEKIDKNNLPDYIVDKKLRSIYLTEQGAKKAEEFFNIDNINAPENLFMLHTINLSMQAYSLHEKGKDYIIRNNEVLLVEPFTGRVASGKKLSDGLHQAIEAKEGIKTKDITTTDASITTTGFFDLYNDFAGMTGTIRTEKREISEVFCKKIVVIPTNKPYIRVDFKDIIRNTYEDKLNYLLGFIKGIHETGQPILIAANSIEHSVQISKMLKSANMPHKLLNAENNEKEAYIVAQAGRCNAITVTTSIAGRGTDILLGGNPDYLAKEMLLNRRNKKWKKDDILCLHYKENADSSLQKTYNNYFLKYKEHTEKEKEKVVSLGGLMIVGAEHYDAKRIDNQLKGRSGRQGDPGASVYIVSLEDDLLKINSNPNTIRFFSTMLDKNIKPPRGFIRYAQKQSELSAAESRKEINNYDAVDSRQRDAFYTLRRRVLNEENLEEMLNNCKEKYVEIACSEMFTTKKKRKTAIMSFNEKYKTNFDFDNAKNKKEFKKYIFKKVNDAFDDREKVLKKNKSDIIILWQSILLASMDIAWQQYLDYLHNLRDLVQISNFSINPSSVVYKNKTADSFNVFINLLIKTSVSILIFSDIS